MDTLATLEVFKVDTLPCPFLPEDAEPLVSFCYGYDDEGYLVTDGLPMAEYDTHRKNMTNVIEALEAHFLARGVPAYVAGNNFIHYQKGDRNRYVSPDCYVVFGVEQRPRDNYKSWESGDRLPSVALEITSEKTQKTDAVEKYLLYERMVGVQEYLRFDPRGAYLNPKLVGFTLVNGRYKPMPYEPDGRLYSVELDLYLEVQGEWLRLYDAKTGEYLRTPAEAEQERVQEKERAERALAAEEAERKRAEAERQRANAAEVREDAERRRAEAERSRAEKALLAEATERQRADAEANAREAAESELARLRAELEALRKSP